MTTGTQPIRIGVLGGKRGASFAHLAPRVGLELAAVCDQNTAVLESLDLDDSVARVTDFSDLLSAGLDAVFLANYFHEHAPFALQALSAGKHVISETSACKTMGEGVALARAVEASGCVYFFAENYCYMAVVQEMRRLYLEGLLGTPRHLEGEYVHPIPPEGYDQLSPGLNHWRNWIPYTYYCTHALGPLMYMSDAEPVEVSARSIPYTPEARAQLHVKRSDWSSVMLCAMDTGAVATVNGGPSALPGHGTWYRLYGERGLAENLREYGKHHKLRLVFNDWEVPSGYTSEQIYAPDFPELGEEAARAGHGGGDFFVLHHFAQALRTGSAPWLDVYRGLAMTTVGIQAWRSALAGGRPYPIPNWRDEAERAPYADDHWSPFPEDAGPGQPPPSLDGFVEPTPEQIAAARAVWEEMDRQ